MGIWGERSVELHTYCFSVSFALLEMVCDAWIQGITDFWT